MKDFLVTCLMVAVLGAGFLLVYAAAFMAVIGILIGVAWWVNP